MTAAIKGAPATTPRETHRPEFPAVVHAYTDALRALQRHGEALPATELARITQRDPSNMRRDLNKLRDAGVVAPIGALGGESTLRWELTDKGRRWVEGFDHAEGRTVSALDPPPSTLDPSLPVWPLDRILPNPDNRKVDASTIPDMADSLVERGQLQPIILTPVRDDGMRMMLIGERRWRGALLARDEGRLPESLQAGLRFEEREATPDEAAGIVLVENIQRQDIPPLEQCFLFAAYADRHAVDGKPLRAREVARRLGMERNERDISDKIRIARKATPEALAAYAEDGSWDRLRDSIPSDRASPAKAEGEKADEVAGIDVRLPPWVCDFDTAWNDGWRRLRLMIFAHPDGSQWWISLSTNFADGGVGESYIVRGENRTHPTRLAALAAARVRLLKRHPKPPVPALMWLDQLFGPNYVNGIDRLNASNAGEARRALGWEKRHSNSGGGQSLKATLQDLADRDAATNDSADPSTPDPRPSTPTFPATARLAVIEAAHKINEQRRPLDLSNPGEWSNDPHEDYVAFGCVVGAHWLDGAVQAAIAGGWLEVVQHPGGAPALLALTGQAIGAFMRGQDELPALPVRMDPLCDAQGALHPVDGTLYVTESLALETRTAGPADAMSAAVADGPFADAAAPVDLWNRDADQIAADADLLERIKAFADPDRPTHDGDTASALLLELGATPMAEVNDLGVVFLATEHGPLDLIHVDPQGQLPDSRATGLAWLIAWAIETAIGGEAR